MKEYYNENHTFQKLKIILKRCGFRRCIILLSKDFIIFV